MALPAKVRVRERDRELVVIVPNRGTQKERSGALQFQNQPGEKSCPVVVEACVPVLAGPDIAILIEQDEGVAVLQDSNGLIGQTRVGENAMSVLRTAINGLFYELWKSAIRSCPYHRNLRGSPNLRGPMFRDPLSATIGS